MVIATRSGADGLGSLESPKSSLAQVKDPKHRIAARVAMELQNGDVVNLGIGIPTLVADYLPSDVRVHLHTENGMVGIGPTPPPDHIDPNLVNAGKLPVSERPGAAYFPSHDSFAMIRGGHVDVAILGILQADRYGRIANWAVPGKAVLGVGGAMDLLVGARRVYVATTHTSSTGQPKLVEECVFPLTANRAADLIVTDLAVFRVIDGELVLVELMPDATLQQVALLTEAPYKVDLISPEA